MRGTQTKRFVAGWMLVFAAVVSGCATGPQANASDPLEPFNRAMYSFNDTADRVVLKPVAETYQDITPQFVRTTIGNFFSNLGDLSSSMNAALQLRPVEATTNFMRFAVNSVFGLAGLIDLATPMGLTKTSHDLGQTLGRWGVPMGPYIMLPFAGPSTLRDTASSSVELYEGIDIEPTKKSEQNTIKVLKVLNDRANLLDATNTLDSIALDKYSFLRDVYLKKREATTQPIWTPEPADDGWGDGTANGDSWDDTPADNTVQ